MADKIKKECSFEDEILTLFDEIESPLNDEDDSFFVDDDELQEDLKLFYSLKAGYVRLKECVDDETRNKLISQLTDFNFVSKKHADFLNCLSLIKECGEKIIQQFDQVSPFVKLNQILKMFQFHNEVFEMMKGFDEDVLVSRAVLDSSIPYSEDFAEAVLRMRIMEEEKTKNKKVSNSEIEKTVSEIQEVLTAGDDFLYDEKGENFDLKTEDDFQEDVLEENSFQTRVLNQEKLFKMEQEGFYFLSECFYERLKDIKILDTNINIEVSFYPQEILKLFELNARLYSQKFVKDYFFQPQNTFVDVQAASKECFKPLFLNVLSLRKSFSQKAYSKECTLKEKELEKELSLSWSKLVNKISKDDHLLKSIRWQNFVAAVEQGDIAKIEETWLLFDRSEKVSDDINLLYFDFILLLIKKITQLPIFPSKDIPYSPFEMVVLLEEIEKKERLNLRCLLKWILKCVLLDFQTFINMPLLKRVMKDMHEIICSQIDDELKSVFFIYKKTVKRMCLMNKIAVNCLKNGVQNEANDYFEKLNKNVNSTLFSSILLNDLNLFKNALKKGSFVNDVTSFGETPLILLTKLERFDWVDVLLKYKPNVNAFDFNGGTCAHYLAELNNVKMLKKIAKMGANLNRVNADECTPLFIGVECANLEVVRFLLDENVAINKGNFLKKTPLHIALENGDKKLASLLIEKGADIFARDKNLKTALHYAAISGMGHLIFDFVDNGFNINARDIQLRTPLHMACLYGQELVVKKLIEMGADINLKDVNGQTPLHIATAVGSSAIVSVLLSNGAQVDLLDNQGQSALYLATINKQKKSFKELVELSSKIYAKTKDLSSVATLVQEGADRALKSCLKKHEGCNSFFDMALFVGVFRESKALVEKAIEHGSHLKDLTVGEKTALEWALEIGNLEIIELLYANNCLKKQNPKTNMGHSSLIEAIVQNDIAKVRLLVKSGADVNSHDAGTKHSVLHYASAIGNVKAIDILVANGADINVKDIRGKTPLFVARQAHQYEAENLLLSLGAEDDEFSKPVSYLDVDE